MNSARLVRFLRSHADDDECVAMRFGPYPGLAAYFEQLRLELADGELVCTDDLKLVYGELRIIGEHTGDAYALYVRVPSFDTETATQVATRLQEAYDLGGVFGWFQVIE